MAENVTDKMLVKLINTSIDKDRMITDITGLAVIIRKASNCNRIYFKFRKVKHGKRTDVPLGTYPEMSLNEARSRYFDALTSFKENSLVVVKKADTFEIAWKSFIDLKYKKIKLSTAEKYESNYRTHLFKLAKMQLKELTAEYILNFLQAYIHSGELGTANRLANVISNVLDFAVFQKKIAVNPIRGIEKYLPQAEVVHYDSFKLETLEQDMTQLFVDMQDCSKTIQLLLYMYFFTLLRSVELRSVKLSDINLNDCSMTVKTKTMAAFKVALCSQAMDIVKYLISVHKPINDYLFQGKTGMISENTLSKALKTNGYKDKLQVHGIRACGRQWLQTLPYAKESIIELCLSHVVGNKVQQAYNRSTYFDERKVLMQEWGNFIESCGDYKSLLQN